MRAIIPTLDVGESNIISNNRMNSPNVIMPRYGAVDPEATEQNPLTDRQFDETQTYYLKAAALTPSERLRKCLRIGAPLIIALLIVGGATLFLSKDFRHLYPGPGGTSSSGSGHRVYPAAVPHAMPRPPTTPEIVAPAPSLIQQPMAPLKPTTPAPTVPEALHALPTLPPVASSLVASTSKNASSSACLAHETCWKLKLEGECCPTPENVTLDCCSG